MSLLKDSIALRFFCGKPYIEISLKVSIEDKIKALGEPAKIVLRFE